MLPTIKSSAWPQERLAEAIISVARHSGLHINELATETCRVSGDQVGEWMDAFSIRAGIEAYQVDGSLDELESELQISQPAVLRIADSQFLGILGRSGSQLRVLGPDLLTRRIRINDIRELVAEPFARPHRARLERLVTSANLSGSASTRAIAALLREELRHVRFSGCWTLHPSPGAPMRQWFADAGALRTGLALTGAHLAQYLLWFASWAILGQLSLAGRMDTGLLWFWALLLITSVPFRLSETWIQGLLAVRFAGDLKRRLLLAAMKLHPDETLHQGLGNFFGQVVEADALETAAVNSSVVSALSLMELFVAGIILGIYGWVLLGWTVFSGLLAWLYLRIGYKWVANRIEMTEDLVEAMAGHRTRLAQQRQNEWHEEEDHALERYFGISRRVDSAGLWIGALTPRGWLVCGLICLIPQMVTGHATAGHIAVSVGGVLLAWSAFKKLAGSAVELIAAIVAWRKIKPLFDVAARPRAIGHIADGLAGNPEEHRVIEAERLHFRYRNDGGQALRACSLTIHRRDRVLLEGPSGGGKTTLASMLSGGRVPDSGLLLLRGLDRHTVGEIAWRKKIATAPQFHENHILTETLAFNLLMGRHWPPTAKDMQDAEALCRELGLRDLLDRMPGGLMQMVGEGGWQLSHGERSRIFIARALLQRADMVILDESFAALDPENLRRSLDCTLRHAETLMVIAHP